MLQALVLDVRLKLAILDQLEFPVSAVRSWSDSQIIIKYIRNTSKKFLVFVMNRKHGIRLNSTIPEWENQDQKTQQKCVRVTPHYND